MVKPDLDLWTETDPIFRVVNRFCILCLIGSRVRSDNGRVGSSFSICSPLCQNPWDDFDNLLKKKILIYVWETAVVSCPWFLVHSFLICFQHSRLLS
ncbi:hypothetical protein Hanom_Chr02g00164871 [Helianthus anomalus]